MSAVLTVHQVHNARLSPHLYRCKVVFVKTIWEEPKVRHNPIPYVTQLQRKACVNLVPTASVMLQI